MAKTNGSIKQILLNDLNISVEFDWLFKVYGNAQSEGTSLEIGISTLDTWR